MLLWVTHSRKTDAGYTCEVKEFLKHHVPQIPLFTNQLRSVPKSSPAVATGHTLHSLSEPRWTTLKAPTPCLLMP